MTNKTFIIAGNRNEFDEYIRKDAAEKYNKVTFASLSDYVFVSDATTLKGIRNPHGKFIGSYKTRPDLLEIVEVIAMCNDDPPSKFNELYDRVIKS